MSMIHTHSTPAAVLLLSSTTKSLAILKLPRSGCYVHDTLIKWHSNPRLIPRAATGFGGKSTTKKTSTGFGTKVESPPCPCGGGETRAPYEDCCARYHGGVVEPNAITLMKARYSAFALSQVPYLVRTTHPENVDRAAGDESLKDSISATCKCTRFKGLQIVSAEQGETPEVVFVSFRAKYAFKNDNEERVLVESSRFMKEGKRWLYREQIIEDPESKEKWDLGASLYKGPSEEEKFANKMVTKGKPGVAFRKP